MIAGLIIQDRGLRPDERGDHTARQLPPPANPSPLDLDPSVTVLSDAIRGTGLDYLGDTEEGPSTLLSTARWRHSPFFQRLKHAVEQYWHPDRAFAQHDPGGHIYGYRNRETVIRVVLDAEGDLVRAYVIRPSGADFLDDEARNAIRQAAPFPNPPRGLVDESTGRIVFTFGFIVEMGEQPIFRLRRYGE
jgi:TonB family protein